MIQPLLLAATDAQVWSWVTIGALVIGMLTPIIIFTWTARGWLFNHFPSKARHNEQIAELKAAMDRLEHLVLTNNDRHTKEQQAVIERLTRAVELLSQKKRQ